jgi:hypothetical protein
MISDLVVSYSDADQDGYVDGTGIPEDTLELRYYNDASGVYEPMPGWTVMTEHNQVHADTASTGRFGIVPEPSRWLMLVAGLGLLAVLDRVRGFRASRQ